jgi:hypothetical protein
VASFDEGKIHMSTADNARAGRTAPTTDLEEARRRFRLAREQAAAEGSTERWSRAREPRRFGRGAACPARVSKAA